MRIELEMVEILVIKQMHIILQWGQHAKNDVLARLTREWLYHVIYELTGGLIWPSRFFALPS